MYIPRKLFISVAILDAIFWVTVGVTISKYVI